MPQILNTNYASLNTQYALNASQGKLQHALQKLSSGLRINSARDDAAGLEVATRMTAQSRGMAVAARNANDVISMMETAESGLRQITENFQRMRELAIQSLNGINGSAERQQLQVEYQQLQEHTSAIISGTRYNDFPVLDMATVMTSFVVQVGADPFDKIPYATLSLSDDISIAGTVSATSISAANVARTAVWYIDAALNLSQYHQRYCGGAQSRLEAVISNLQTASNNTAAATSRIMDADYAEESAKLARNQVLQQAGIAMLSQANSSPNLLLSLLR
jgi:flagellin